jgi:putative flippase GtrA
MPTIYLVLAQLARYSLVGGIAFVIDFGLFALCLYALEWHYLLANLMGLIAGLTLNYALSISWVFSDCERRLENRKLAEFSVFAIVGFIGVGINELLMLLLVNFFCVQGMISKMIAATIVLLWNFCSRKLILFKERKTDDFGKRD